MQFIRLDKRGYHLDDYLRYLTDNAEKFPAGAREFALADWHYDREHHQCPHDSWLEFFNITEISSGERNEVRVVEITAKLFGAYHDGYFSLVYRDVSSYSLECTTFRRGKALIGHGDWMVDELTMKGKNIVHHEIEFSEGGTIIVDSADIEYRWLPQKAKRPS
jgi:hypothetical protein